MNVCEVRRTGCQVWLFHSAAEPDSAGISASRTGLFCVFEVLESSATARKITLDVAISAPHEYQTVDGGGCHCCGAGESNCALSDLRMCCIGSTFHPGHWFCLEIGFFAYAKAVTRGYNPSSNSQFLGPRWSSKTFAMRKKALLHIPQIQGAVHWARTAQQLQEGIRST